MVYAGREGDEAVLEVTDNGPGMSEAVLARLYQPFFRAPEARGLPGQGLGLATTKRLVEAHGGTLRIRSAAGERHDGDGALPDAWIGRGREAARPAQARSRRAGVGAMSLPGILVVDDDPHARGLLRRLLGPLGQVSEAASAQAAEELLKGTVPVDVVLTDMAMPDPDDGLQVLAGGADQEPGHAGRRPHRLREHRGRAGHHPAGRLRLPDEAVRRRRDRAGGPAGAGAEAAGGGEQEPPRSR